VTRRGLGRGLGALIPGAGADRGPGPVQELEISALEANPFQPRREVAGAAFDELVASIRTHGVLQPIVVRRGPGGYQVVAGERRWRAAQAAGLITVPAVVKEISDRQALEIALIENLRREDLTPIERARAYRRLADEFRLTQEEMAQVIGGSRSSIANTLRLLDLPHEVQSSIARGRLTEGHGRALLSIPDGRRLLELWRQVETRGLSVRETESLVLARKNVSRETSPRRGRRRDPLLADLAGRLQHRYATTVSIVPKGKKGIIQISYFSQDDLARLFDLLVR